MMDETLSDSGLITCDIGSKPMATPSEAQKSSEGVLVDYAWLDNFTPHFGYHWYVLCADYGRELIAAEVLKDRFLTYVPTHTIVKVDANGRHMTKASYMPNIFFAYTTVEQVKLLREKEYNTIAYPHHQPLHIKPRYDHTAKDENGHDVYMTIADYEMLNFMRLIYMGDEKTRVFLENKFKVQKGDYVRVTEGKFKGVEGYLSRFKHQTCVLVNLSGLISATTAYVPKWAVEKLEDPHKEDTNKEVSFRKTFKRKISPKQLLHKDNNHNNHKDNNNNNNNDG